MKYIFISLIYLLTSHIVAQQTYDSTQVSKWGREVACYTQKLDGRHNSKEEYTPFGGLEKGYNQLFSYNRLPLSDVEQLLWYPNARVRCEAFFSLAYRGSTKLAGYLKQHVYDTLAVDMQWGCCAYGKTTIPNVFLSIINFAYYNEETISEGSMTQIDSLLIMSPVEFEERKEALLRHLPRKGFYTRIKELAKKEEANEALIALARYQNQYDLFIFWTHKFNFGVVNAFPHPAFWPELMDTLEKGASNQVYSAIAAYQNKESLVLLESRINTVKDSVFLSSYSEQEEWQSLHHALATHACVLYEPLLWEFWKSKKGLSTVAFNYLSEKHPKQVLEYVRPQLQKGWEGMTLDTFGMHYSIERQLKATVLAFLKKQDTVLLEKLIYEELPKAGWFEEKLLISYTREIKSGRLLRVLLELFAEHGDDEKACAIIDYHQKEAIQKLKKLRRKDKYCRKGRLYGDKIDACLQTWKQTKNAK